MSFQQLEQAVTTSTVAEIPEVINFDKFTTIDLVEEESRRQFGSSRNKLCYKYNDWRGFGSVLFDRGKPFFTLSGIGITVGCIAGFIQISSETLINLKGGYCSRNWLLNKSFCCVNEWVDSGKLGMLNEVQCVSDGTWILWGNNVWGFFVFIVLSVVFAMFSAFIVKFLAPIASGSGITEIKVHVSGFQYKENFFGLSTLVVKAIALPLAISSGLSVGKEGPSVHYAACCGYLIARYFFQSTLTYTEQSEYLIASSAAGVAVAFGAPIGGVLFGLEEICPSAHFNLSILWKSYYAALCASSTLQYINPFRNGKIVLFEVEYDRDWHVEEISVFLVLGIFGGIYGNYVSKWNIWFLEFRKKYLAKRQSQEVFVLIVITAVLSYFNEFLKLDMTESMGILFHECHVDKEGSQWTHRLCELDENTTSIGFLRIYFELVIATVLRLLGIVVSYGSVVPAGIFVPSMAVGATFGRSVSLLVEKFLKRPSVITPGTYAFLGSAAALSGITNMTLTVVVVMFELTGAFNYIIPTMLVVAFTRIVLTSFGTEGGIADKMISIRGFPFLEYPYQNNRFLDDYCVEDIMTKDLITIKEVMNLTELELLLEKVKDNYSGFPIIRVEDEYERETGCRGYVSLKDLKACLEAFSETGSTVDIMVDFSKDNLISNEDQLINFRDFVNHSPLLVHKSLPLSRLFKMFEKLGCKIVLVEEYGCLVGLITKKDLLRFHRSKNRELFGPLYNFDESLHEKLWSIITKILDKLKGY